MILVDYSGSMFAAIYVELNRSKGTTYSKDILRHILITQLRSYNRKFREQYGKMVICLEGGSCWRKDVFPNYKALRAKSRIDSGIDWKKIFEDMNDITSELMEYLPYKFVRVQGLEADDVIALLTLSYNTIAEEDVMGNIDPVLIISNDKDYKQLHKLRFVTQYLPQKGTIYKEKDPDFALLDLIVHGDKADGIPNINSDINTFVDGKRQKPIPNNMMRTLVSSGFQILNEDQRKRFRENEQLISFNKIPNEYYKKVIDEYSKPKTYSKMKLFNYFAQNKLREQIDHITDF